MPNLVTHIALSLILTSRPVIDHRRRFVTPCHHTMTLERSRVIV
jgi:hypothetical protein